MAAAAFRLRALAEALVSHGWSVDVVTTRVAEARSHRRGPLRISRWPVLRDDNGNVRGYLQYLSFDLPALVRLLARPRAALLIAEPPPTTGMVVRLAASIHRTPFAYYAADVWSLGAMAVGAPRILTRLLRAVEGWAMRGAATVLAVSPGVADEVAALGVDRSRIVVVGNGADTAAFTPDGARKELDGPYFVYAGTVSEWQGAELFLRAFAQHLAAHPTTQLVFLGQGTEMATIRTVAERLAPGRVHFQGVVPPKEAAEWIRGARAALVSIRPGLGYDFAVPTKIFAATACGTPVVFAGRGPARDLVNDNGLGWGVQYDLTEVVEAMGEALQDEARPDSARLVRWTHDNASLPAVGQRAAEAVLRGAGLA